MESICKNLINYMIDRQIIDVNKKEIYTYGMKLTIYKIAYALIILSMCFILKRNLFDLILFYFSYMTIRKYAGGYHAPNIVLCMFIFAVTYYLLEYYLLLASNLNFFVIFILAIILMVLIFLNSPIDCKNKRLNDREKKVYKRYTLRILFFWLICMIVMFELHLPYYSIIFYSFLSIFIFQLI